MFMKPLYNYTTQGKAFHYMYYWIVTFILKPLFDGLLLSCDSLALVQNKAQLKKHNNSAFLKHTSELQKINIIETPKEKSEQRNA